MPVDLRPVTAENYEKVIHLEVNENQRHHVGSITEFLARCYVKAEGYDYFPFAIYSDDTLVGFIMYMGELLSADSHYVGGFLIDRRFQRQGFGKAALILLLRFILERTSCKKITITVHPENSVAISLYGSLGFRDQNWLYHGEEVLSAPVEDLRLA